MISKGFNILLFYFSLSSYSLCSQPAQSLIHEIFSQLDTSSIDRSHSDLIADVHNWIVRNIDYDYRYAKSQKVGIRPIKEILEKKKAICSEYSSLFNTVMDVLNIQSFEVIGYCRECESNINGYDRPNHSWNIVFADSVWRLIDLTWDACLSKDTHGKWIAKSTKYLFPHIDEFAKDHLSSVPMWQLRDTVISLDTFLGRKRPDSRSVVIDYEKEIAKFLSMDNGHRRLYLELAVYNFNPTDLNKSLLGHQLLDMAAGLVDKLNLNDKLEEQQQILEQSRVIALCKTASTMCKLYDWQKAMYAGAIVNNTIFRSNQIFSRDNATDDSWEAIFSDLEKAEYIIRSIKKDFFREPTEQRYAEILEVVSKQLSK